MDTPHVPPPHPPRRWLDGLGWLALVVASLWPLWAAAHNLEFRNDDTYITLTYVKSLVAGEGWRFNGGPVALGTTAPLFALVVAVLAKLLPPIEIAHLAIAWSTFCWLGAGWLMALRGPDFGLSRHGGQIVGVVLLLQSSYWLASVGMEATMLVAGLLLACWLATRDRALAAGVVGALLGLVRPEGWAILPLLALWLLRPAAPERRRQALRFGLGAAIVLLAWSAYALPTFGSILSNSASAKLDQGRGWPTTPFAKRLFVEWLPAHARHFGLSGWLSLLWPLALLGVARVIQRARPLLPLVAWIPCFLLGYALLRAPGFWWYMISVLALLHLLVAVGIARLTESRRPPLRLIGGATLLVYLALLGRLIVLGNASPPHDPRAESYRAVATWLNANTAPEDSVAYVEIGYLGYYSHNRIADLVGLADPALRSNAAHLDLAANFALSQPDYFLYLAPMGWLLDPILTAPDFSTRYEPVAEFPHTQGTTLVLYRRR